MCTELPEGLAACSSLQELFLAGNELVLSAEAVGRLAAALQPHLRRISLSLVAAAGGEGQRAAHQAGAALLAQLFGDRLSLQ